MLDREIVFLSLPALPASVPAAAVCQHFAADSVNVGEHSTMEQQLSPLRRRPLTHLGTGSLQQSHQRNYRYRSIVFRERE